MSVAIEFTRNEIERATDFAKRFTPTTYNRRDRRDKITG